MPDDAFTTPPRDLATAANILRLSATVAATVAADDDVSAWPITGVSVPDVGWTVATSAVPPPPAAAARSASPASLQVGARNDANLGLYVIVHTRRLRSNHDETATTTTRPVFTLGIWTASFLYCRLWIQVSMITRMTRQCKSLGLKPLYRQTQR